MGRSSPACTLPKYGKQYYLAELLVLVYFWPLIVIAGKQQGENVA